jgi:DNA polymerase-1
MNLLPWWADRIAAGATPTPPVDPPRRLPRRRAAFAGRTTFVDSPDAAADLADLALQQPVAWVGLDTEFRHDRPGVPLGRDRVACDPRGVRPLLISLALAVPDGEDAHRLSTFVVDARRPEVVLPALRAVLRLPVPFVAHFARAELCCLWRLGLEEAAALWDTWVAEKALHLGRYHRRYALPDDPDPAGEAIARRDHERAERVRYDLLSACARHGVPHPFAGDKERLQRSFLGHDDAEPFTEEQVAYAAADAVATADLYPAQLQAAARSGLIHHLITIEMPWTTVVARMHWQGVRIDRGRAGRLREAARGHLDALEATLRDAGLANVRSPRALQAHFERLGLLELFRKRGRHSFDQGQLERFADRHPTIPLIRAARKALDLLDERILDGALEGADGRVHPDYYQLGTHTGRLTSRWPNALGLGRVFRPLVVPEPGHGLGEVDLCQIEVGVAAAVYDDLDLIAAFNTGDVYAALAREFYRDRLTADDLALPQDVFKLRHRPLRDRMKAVVLGLIYGQTASGLAQALGIGPAEAQALRDGFLGRYPALARSLAAAVEAGACRGYAASACGLRRHRPGAAPPSPRERNWLVNHPVQASAADAFKLAGIRLDRLYRRYDARLVVSVHDAFVFEAPLDRLADVAELTGRVMCEAVQELFPRLLPRVEVNVAHPGCWNKDGHADALDRWCANPLYTL